MLLSRRMGGRRSRTVRRLLAAALLVAAGALALTPNHTTEGTAVLAAAHDLPVGTVLTLADLRTITLPTPPDGALPAAAAGSSVGRVLASPVRGGETLTDVRILSDQGPDPGPGRVALPIPIGDRAVAALLRPGMRITLVGVTGGGSGGIDGSRQDTVQASSLTSAAIVLATSADQGSDLSRGQANTVLVSVPADAAPAVTAASVADTLLVQFGP